MFSSGKEKFELTVANENMANMKHSSWIGVFEFAIGGSVETLWFIIEESFNYVTNFAGVKEKIFSVERKVVMRDCFLNILVYRGWHFGRVINWASIELTKISALFWSSWCVVLLSSISSWDADYLRRIYLFSLYILFHTILIVF